jgi:hypothetical protein
VKWYYRILRIPLIFYCFFIAAKAYGQLNRADSSFYQSTVSEALDLYHQSAGDQSGLYNGPMYSGYPFRFESGTPFFGSGRLDTGSVFYDGILYLQVPLLYEDLKDLLIINDNGYFIQLKNKLVKEFSLPGHYFVRLGENDITTKGINTGFYEVLNQDSIAVLKKTVKKILDDLASDNVVQKQISQSVHYYIKTATAVYEINNERDILAIFPEKKKEIQQFVKKNKLNFNEDKGNTIIKIVVYYEQIRNQQ